MLRTPAVAGQFYPGQETELRRMLAEMLPTGIDKKPSIGVMSPHAGLVFSGKVAGQTLAGAVLPQKVVILGPNHHGAGHVAAVYQRGTWRTPLGDIPIAESLADRILNECPSMAADAAAHRFEHSLEVQVPFLQVLLPGIEIVPICLSRLPLGDLLAMGSGLARAVRDTHEHPLLLASSDMTHFESGEAARKKDFRAIERILDLDPEGLFETVMANHISMCGVMPTVVMLQAARELGATGAELVEYSNSGDVTGDQSDVVGYAGVRVF